MQASAKLTLTCKNQVETDAFGRLLAQVVSAGDLLTLNGPLGVGKSHLCRAVIRCLLADPSAEVPSPSYTLVNVYEAAALDIWHADLYRLGDASELAEIGLDDALETALVLLEWPDRWASLPKRRLDLTLSFLDGDERLIQIQAYGSGWDQAQAAIKAAQ